jgi:hypothetical protein
MDIQFGESVLWKVVVVDELAENSCVWGMRTARELTGRGKQDIREDTAE